MKPNTAHIVFVLDRSGSMQSMCTEAVVSYNRFLDEQKQLPQEATFDFVLFNTTQDHRYSGDLKNAPLLTEREYAPHNGTALYDAMADAILDTGKKLAVMREQDRPEVVIIATMTDGQENSSIRFGRADGKRRLADMIKHQQEVYNWQFTFLGANMDVQAEAVDLNIPVAHAASWDNSTPESVTYGFAANSGLVTRARTGG